MEKKRTVTDKFLLDVSKLCSILEDVELPLEAKKIKSDIINYLFDKADSIERRQEWQEKHNREKM